MYDSLKVKSSKAVDDTCVAVQTRFSLRFDLKNNRTYMENLHYPYQDLTSTNPPHT
jgi:hypothetical protein